jgi:hypothetical protein
MVFIQTLLSVESHAKDDDPIAAALSDAAAGVLSTARGFRTFHNTLTVTEAAAVRAAP